LQRERPASESANSGANANHDALIYFALSGVLLGAAFVGRARQLRSD
jgi:hypothetical protein